MASTATYASRAERVLVLRKKSSEQSLNPTERTEYCNLRKKMAAAGIDADSPARMLIWHAQIVDNRAQVKEYCDILFSRRPDPVALKRAANELRDVGINPDKSLKQALGKINNNARIYASKQKEVAKQKKRPKQQTTSPTRRAAEVTRRHKTVKRMLPNGRLSFA